MSNFLQVQENQRIARRRTSVRRTSDSADLSAFGEIDAEIAEKGHFWTETRSERL
jgi:hypothetical protein